MGETDPGAIPYPELDDPPHGPNQLQALAERVQALLESGQPFVAARTVRGWLLVPTSGNIWYVTGDPFGAVLGVVATGDFFTYPDGHAQEGETYEWNGATWVFGFTLTALPSGVDFAVRQLT